MVIGIDIDDTITRHPGFFAFLTEALIAAGHRVVIITFREDRERTAAALEAWGVQWTELVTSDLSSQLEHGVDEWKGVMCREHGVEVLFEDDPDVLMHVDPAITRCMVLGDGPDPRDPRDD
jgi:hypothetical protein